MAGNWDERERVSINYYRTHLLLNLTALCLKIQYYRPPPCLAPRLVDLDVDLDVIEGVGSTPNPF